jgi:DNA-binding response OmpR family regulator
MATRGRRGPLKRRRTGGKSASAKPASAPGRRTRTSGISASVRLAGPPPRRPRGSVAKPRVLVVEDDGPIGEVTKRLLETEGFRVDVLPLITPDAVDETITRFAPDVVLLDSAAASDFGPSWDLAAQVRAVRRAPALVMFSAHSAAVHEAREGASPRSIAAGFAAVIEKPFTIEVLVTAVRSALMQRSTLGTGPHDNN